MTTKPPAQPSGSTRSGGSSSSPKSVLPAMPSENRLALVDLTIYTAAQLVEMRDRQAHLLANKKRLQQLPDGGARIRNAHQHICAELATRDAVQQASDMFSALNIAATGKRLITHMEWNGRNGGAADADAAAAAAAADAAYEADDERNPLRLLAQARHTAKRVQVEPPVETLITDADRQQIAEFEAEKKAEQQQQQTTTKIVNKVDAEHANKHNVSSGVGELEPHAVYMCSIDQRHSAKKERFLPHKTTVKHTTTAAAEKDKETDSVGRQSPMRSTKQRDNTAATYPELRNQAIVTLSLQDSIEIQRKQYEALKSVELQNANERLRAHEQLVAKLRAERDKLDDGRLPSTLFGDYRTPAEHSDDENDEDDLRNDERSDSENSANEDGGEDH